MLTIREYARPQTMDEAMTLLKSNKKSQVLGGGMLMLKLGDKTIDLAVDLVDLGLDYIKPIENAVEIGAMATFHSIETDPYLKNCFSGMWTDAMKYIVGVQFRNLATLGATAYSKYAFSDPNTALLALDAELVMYGDRRMAFDEFLAKRKRRFDILEKIVIKNPETTKAAFDSIRRSKGDFAVLNAAASVCNSQYRISVGIRPRVAKLATGAMAYLNENGLTTETAKTAAKMAADELDFATNLRASGEYRKAVAPALIERVLLKLL